MRVLGVDPGLTRCGLGVIDGAPGRAPTLVAADVLRTPAGDDIAARLLALEAGIEEWLTAHQPDAMAVERVFSQHNVRTVMGTAQAGAVAIVCAARRGLPVALHTPSEVKAAVTGSGRAGKDQVTAMVMRLLRLDAPAPARRHGRRAGAGHLPSVARRDAAPPGRRGRGGRPGMISHLDGRVSAIAPEGAVIEVGGVGLLVQCTPGTLATLRPGERARVATSLVVREDALTLFGFAADDERDVFELLQTASGVGPRLALAMLAVFTPDALRRAVAAEDVTALTRVPGIGRKGAQRIILELAGRLGPPGVAGGRAQQGQLAAAGPGLPGAEPWRDQVRAGLLNLGWQAREADQAIAAVAADVQAASGAGGSNGGDPTGGGANGDGGQHGDGGAADGTRGEVDVAAMLRAALRKLSRA